MSYIPEFSKEDKAETKRAFFDIGDICQVDGLDTIGRIVGRTEYSNGRFPQYLVRYHNSIHFDEPIEAWFPSTAVHDV